MQLAIRWALSAVLAMLLASPRAALAQDGDGALLELRFTPAPRVQLAIWVEDDRGRVLRTLALTEAVAFRGVGNRPGASQMNSGYRWPYGRREGVLPIWAHRRAQTPGARAWKRVIFQDRTYEGLASRTSADSTVDDYFCLSFARETTAREALDAVSCASVFTSDKGRFLNDADVEAGYAEPWQEPTSAGGSSLMMPLPAESLYPPRMDVVGCTGPTCLDHPDLGAFASHAREVMPDIDAVTMATPPGGVEQSLLFTLPADWPEGDYVLWIEAALEGDYNASYDATEYPTPTAPAGTWDSWARTYGYPYRGQPSVAYSIPVTLAGPGTTVVATAEAPAGRSSWDVWDDEHGTLQALTGITDDPQTAPGSGADRLRATAQGLRATLSVEVLGLAVPVGEDPWSALFPSQLPPDDTTTPGPTDDEDGTIEESAPGTAEPPEAPPTTDEGDEEPPPPPPTTDANEGEGVILANDDDVATSPVGPVRELRLARHPNELHSHAWIALQFRAVESEEPLHRYEVRVSTQPIVDEATFIQRGRPAKTATTDLEGAVALMLPPDTPSGELISSAIGDLAATTRYYVAVRATDRRNRSGPISVAEITTTERTFATVSPCFVASAAYGTPLASEVSVLRRVRDRYLLPHAPGRWLVAQYYAHGPQLAAMVQRSPWRARAVRAMLWPLVRSLRWLGV